jgi:hypothetical protein
MKNKNNFALIILNLIIFFILCYALLQNGIWRGHDWLAHFQRLISLNEELDAQQFPPLFNYWLPGQFGYSWQLFYPPLTSFLFLLARIITFNSTDNILQMKIVLFIIFVIAFICAFYAGKREHNSSAAGYLCTILFITSGYFLTNIFIRFALGEMLAMAFMPLFLRGCSSLLGDRRDIWLIPFSALAIALSNMPSLIVTAIFFLLFFIINIKRLINRINIRFFLESLICFMALSAFYWIPLLYHMRHSDIFATHAKLLSYEDVFRFSSGIMENLFSLPSKYGVSNHGMYLSVGVIQLLIAIGYLRYGRSAPAKKVILVALFFILAATHLLPWYLLPDRFSFLKIMQFPWRLLSCATAIVALFTSGMLAGIWQRRPLAILLVAALCIASMFFPMNQALTERHTRLEHMGLWDDYLNNSNIREDNFAHLYNNDFAYFANKNASITTTGYTDGYPDMIITVRGEQTVTLPYIMYAGYYLLVDDKKTDVSRLDNGLVGVKLTAGEHRVSLLYERNIVVVPMMVSIISFFIISFIIIFRHRRVIRIRMFSQRFLPF